MLSLVIRNLAWPIELAGALPIFFSQKQPLSLSIVSDELAIKVKTASYRKFISSMEFLYVIDDLGHRHLDIKLAAKYQK